MRAGLDPFRFLLISLAVWMKQQQPHAIAYLVGRKSCSSRADRPSLRAIQRLPTAAIGGQSQDSGMEMAVSNRNDRDAGHFAGMASRLVAQKYDGTENRRPGRPHIFPKCRLSSYVWHERNRNGGIGVSTHWTCLGLT